jgi:hypothetical protein
MSTSEVKRKRPISVWIIYIISILAIGLFSYGVAMSLFFIVMSLLKGSFHISISGILFLLVKIAGLLFFLFAFFSIKKPNRIGWYFCIVAYLLVAGYCFYDSLHPSKIGSGPLDPSNDSQQLSMIYFSVLVGVSFVGLAISFFKKNMKLYFNIE